MDRFFPDWVFEIEAKLKDTAKPMKGTLPLFSGSSRVLSFNYTSTVEELYGVDDICHIHGFAKDRGNFIFGHADDGPYQKEKDPMARRIGFVGGYPT